MPVLHTDPPRYSVNGLLRTLPFIRSLPANSPRYCFWGPSWQFNNNRFHNIKLWFFLINNLHWVQIPKVLPQSQTVDKRLGCSKWSLSSYFLWCSGFGNNVHAVLYIDRGKPGVDDGVLLSGCASIHDGNNDKLLL